MIHDSVYNLLVDIIIDCVSLCEHSLASVSLAQTGNHLCLCAGGPVECCCVGPRGDRLCDEKTSRQLCVRACSARRASARADFRGLRCDRACSETRRVPRARQPVGWMRVLAGWVQVVQAVASVELALLPVGDRRL